MTKTPDEIKNGLECCSNVNFVCNEECPYYKSLSEGEDCCLRRNESMWIIKNRVTGEYERKGMSGKRDKVNRHAWDTLARAKCHVVYTAGRLDEWFLDADFVEVTEDGIGLVIPVSDYLREHYSDPRQLRWMCDAEKNKLKNAGLLPEPPKEDAK